MLQPTLTSQLSMQTDPQGICTARKQDVVELKSKEPVLADQ
jgi:hypothetical protein